MPYTNMPEALWAKMDRCVEDLQAQGHDKETAVAICYTSIMGAQQVQQASDFNPFRLLWRGIAGLLHLNEPEQQASPMIVRQADGQYRWFGIAATAVINHDNVIDSRDLFDSFIQHIRETNEYPLYDVMHLGERCVIGKADFVARDDAIYFATGTFNQDEFSQAAARTLQASPDYWGHSIAFVSSVPGELNIFGLTVPVYTSGINQFISVVPRSRAASLFTDVAVQQRSQEMAMSDEQFQVLVRLVGPELAAQKRDELARLNRTINEAGLIQRIAENPAPAPTADAPAPAATPAAASAPDPAEAQTAQSVPAPDLAASQISEANGPSMHPESEQRAEPTMGDVMAAINTMSEKMQAMMDAIAGAQQEVKQFSSRLSAIEQPIEERIAQSSDDAPETHPIMRPSVTRNQESGAAVDPTDTLAMLEAQRNHRRH